MKGGRYYTRGVGGHLEHIEAVCLQNQTKLRRIMLVPGHVESRFGNHPLNRSPNIGMAGAREWNHASRAVNSDVFWCVERPNSLGVAGIWKWCCGMREIQRENDLEPPRRRPKARGDEVQIICTNHRSASVDVRVNA